MSAGDWTIERIARDHDRSGFTCGNSALDDYLARFARQNDRSGISRTYVATRPGSAVVKGFYTVRTGQVAFRGLPEAARRRLPRYPMPVIHIARLAVAEDAKGCGLGARLLVSALELALAVSEKIGVHAVEALAKDEAARSFYANFGFESLPSDRLHMYLSMKALSTAARKPKP